MTSEPVPHADRDHSETPHQHTWTRHQNATTRGYILPPYEACKCGAARQVDDEVERVWRYFETDAPALRAQRDKAEAEVERLTSERDRAREECGHEKAMRRSIRDELGIWIDKARAAESALARVEALHVSRTLYEPCPNEVTGCEHPHCTESAWDGEWFHADQPVGTVCATCEDSGDFVTWPCATAAALAGPIEVEESL